MYERVAKLELTQQYHETRLARTEDLTNKTNELLREKITEIAGLANSFDSTKGHVDEIDVDLGEVKSQVKTLANHQNNPILFTLTKRKAIAVAGSALVALIGSQFLWDIIRSIFFSSLGH